jgi:prevent-host-death family protein
METVNIHEAKTHLSRLIARIVQGEEIIIAKAGKPVARLVRYTADRAPRVGGQWKGLVHIHDDFDAPLPPEMNAGFQGEGL